MPAAATAWLSRPLLVLFDLAYYGSLRVPAAVMLAALLLNVNIHIDAEVVEFDDNQQDNNNNVNNDNNN